MLAQMWLLYQPQNETARRRVLTLREITLHLAERPRCSYLEPALYEFHEPQDYQAFEQVLRAGVD